MNQEGYICIFDCESIPDTELIRKTLNLKGDDLEISKKALELQKEQTSSEFLPLPYHKIISICAVITNSFGKFIKVNKIDGDDEQSMIANFFKFIDKYEPKLVSFNGKNYDMPLLVLRALKYNIKANTYLDTITDKWNNYKTRFSENKHCDLFEAFGSYRGLKLDLICAMVNLPGKYEIHGNEVLELFYENKLEKIHEYCESDTLNTFMLFLKYEFIKGNINENDFIDSLNAMKEFLMQKKQNRSYIDLFIKASEDEISKIKLSI
ncbi:polysaccharide biosynthesis protein [Campylobacter novaezeelandiae]|uniref:Polysaccharide biosynthesis protein n=1 Tax=Campylobacter novaezeelandiae TaxID=2267891 RepID=A0A4Q9JTP4_9BACT|nr:3'-5' exonuclease [Campylobacter novaezeelandiae]QWU80443.1 putative polysaccharide biosynthesis protein [Campylobacter novaezeelandiae]TBR78526.1 polysaccharide biosynthesis protein [Campylobacter novaezeelandiae]TBR78596.1 polysaccharide biosynthesis protein [Campylobacter novaezeelandiae]TBR78634.1 polysaccharide biosynthesis protein [Campylobacter novaezeelandiae]TBR80487.1 polysaccharide biosynthesis protein [Campylobacter novaezeelandiae]